jgi:hypothetical protein
MKNLLLGGLATLAVASPVMAQTATLSSGLSANDPPSLALGYDPIPNNITCRSKARAKFFELGARDMSSQESNSQWATVNNMRAIVWCRENHAIVGVTGHSYNSVQELRDEIRKAF